MGGSVGLVANPHAGKDVRRLVTHASPTSDAAKIGIVRRAGIGAIEGGATRLVMAPDVKHLTRRALDGLGTRAEVVELDMWVEGRPTDTVRAAALLRDHDVDVVLALGGDGTSRDIAKGWLDAPLIAISTGTNNVFPRQIEATVAGMAAGAVASGRVPMADVSSVSDVIHVTLADGRTDLALVDVALLAERFVGSRAVWDPASLREMVACIAEPASVGLSAVAAAILPLPRRCEGGVAVGFGTGRVVRAPIAPGTFADLAVRSARWIGPGETVSWTGPGVLAFDGERDLVLTETMRAELVVRRDGPRVIDIDRAMQLALPHP
jgi:predicted polyphosphate/ATP-dependent NAD kinase